MERRKNVTNSDLLHTRTQDRSIMNNVLGSQWAGGIGRGCKAE